MIFLITIAQHSKLQQPITCNEVQTKLIQDCRSFDHAAYEADLKTELSKVEINSNINVIFDQYEVAAKEALNIATPTVRTRRWFASIIHGIMTKSITPGICVESKFVGRRDWRFNDRFLPNIETQLTR